MATKAAVLAPLHARRDGTRSADETLERDEFVLPYVRLEFVDGSVERHIVLKNTIWAYVTRVGSTKLFA